MREEAEISIWYKPLDERYAKTINQEKRIREILVGTTVEDILPYGYGLMLRRADGSLVEFTATGYEFEVDVTEREPAEHPA